MYTLMLLFMYSGTPPKYKATSQNTFARAQVKEKYFTL